MNALNLEKVITRLPPGRARARYQRMASRFEDAMILTVPYSDQPLWLVPDLAGVRLLIAMGLPRWRIWTLEELKELLAAFGNSVGSLGEAAEALRRSPG